MELEQDNSIDDLTKPQVFLSQINTLKEKLPSILDDFKKYYVFYNNNTEYNEYSCVSKALKRSSSRSNSCDKSCEGSIYPKL